MSIDAATPGWTDSDYLPAAELFAMRRLGRKRDLYYRRFDSTADAIKFAIEDMPAGSSNITIETEFSRLDAARIAELYSAERFPLRRRPQGAA